MVENAMTIINDIIKRDHAAAVDFLRHAQRGTKCATVGRVTIYPAFNGRGLKMDDRKRLTREIGGENRVDS